MSTRNVQPAAYEGSRGQNYDANEALSLIDRHSSLDGTYRSNRDLRIEGEVKGTIECRGTLHIAQGAHVDAQVEAENVVVGGELSGEIICRGRLQLLPTGRLRGKVSTATLVINEGAIYEGQLEMMNPENGRLATLNAAPRPITSGVSSQTRQQSPAPSVTQAAAPPAAAPVPSEPEATAATTEMRPRMDQPAQQNSNTSTFIRRFGGPETPWDANRDDEGGENER